LQAAAQQAPRCAAPITAASYAAPTRRYPHGVLGDDEEWGALRVTCGAVRLTATLPQELVFEDVAPRLADVDGDGAAEVVTVESHADLGARLAVWGLEDGRLARRAATPHIGQRNRWLAPLGAADLDGDGRVEIAYVDRPHLARILRVWRYDAGRLEQIAALPGVTNHRIGEPYISGGIRDCGDGVEIIAADAGWRHLLAIQLHAGELAAREIAPVTGRQSFADALACR
jgi:hypothetical protein